MKNYICIIFIGLALTLGSVGPGQGAEKVKEVVVMTHDSFSIGKDVVIAFERAHGARVRFLKAGDAGSALNQAILSKNNPLADVFFGVDNTFLTRALEAGIFEAYDSPLLAAVADNLKLDPQNRLLPVDFGDVCLNYDKKWLADKGLAPPSALEDLVKPAYKGLTVVENPATSSPGLAFLLTTISRFGETGYLDFWKKLRTNDVLVVDGWEKAYWGHFSAASDGTRPIVVSYASSPPAEVYFSEKNITEPPTAAVVEPGTCFRQVEFVGILKGAAHPELARKWVDFMLDKKFQEDIPLNMFVWPANLTAALPDVFVKHARVASEPASIPPDKITAFREAWIEAWTNTVLR